MNDELFEPADDVSDYALPGDEPRAESQDDTPEPEASAAPSEPEPSSEASLYAGKFKTDAELEAAYLELQRVSGRQGTELGELRALVDEQLGGTLDDVEPLDPDDEGGVFDWAGDPSYAPPEAAFAPDPQEEAMYQEAANQYIASRPDFARLQPQMAAIAAQVPEVLDVLNQGSAAERLHALNALYTQAQQTDSTLRREAEVAVAKQHVVDAHRAALEATVVSSGYTGPTEAPLSAADQIGAEWERIEAPYRDGWRIQ